MLIIIDQELQNQRRATALATDLLPQLEKLSFACRRSHQWQPGLVGDYELISLPCGICSDKQNTFGAF